MGPTAQSAASAVRQAIPFPPTDFRWKTTNRISARPTSVADGWACHERPMSTATIVKSRGLPFRSARISRQIRSDSIRK